MIEKFKDIKGYEDLYEISNLGRVRSKDRVIEKSNGYPQRISSRWIHPYILQGTMYIVLSKHSKPEHYTLKSLLSRHFSTYKIVSIQEPIEIREGEVFVPLAEHEGLYEISNYGNIVSLGRTIKRKDGIDRVVHRKKLNHRTAQLCLSGNGKTSAYSFNSVFLKSFYKWYNPKLYRAIKIGNSENILDNFRIVRRMEQNPITVIEPNGAVNKFDNYIEAGKKYKIPTQRGGTSFLEFFFQEIDYSYERKHLEGFQFILNYPAYKDGELKLIKIVTYIDIIKLRATIQD